MYKRCYIVKYRGSEDKQGPVFNRHCYAANAEHAALKFDDSNCDQGWEIVSVDRPRTPRGAVDTQFDRT